MYDQLIRLLLDITATDPPSYGLTGWEDANGDYAIVVPDDPNLIYVRIQDGEIQTAIEAINLNVPRQPDYPVIVYYKNKEAYAIPDPERSRDYRGLNEGISTVPPHSHEPDFGNFDVVSTRRMREGQIIVTQPYSMSVTCTPLKYWDGDGVERIFYSDTLDLTGYIPATANTHCYTKIYLDTDTALLGAIAGTAKSALVQLTEEDIIAITLTDNQKPLAAVRLINGMTAIDDDKLIVDWRFWVQSRSVATSIIDKILTDENGDVLSDENGDVLTEE